MDGLIEYDKYGIVQSSLATEWSSNDDNTVWTFKIGEGVKWVTNEGEEYADVVAQDFVDGLNYVLDAKNESSTAWIATVVGNGNAFYNGEITDFSQVGVKAKDKYTLEYTLENPTPYFLSMLTYVCFSPVNGEFLAEKGDSFGTTNENVLYNGGYILDKFEPENERVLVKNKTYWDKDNILIDRIRYKYNKEVATVAPELFLRGETDAASIPTSLIDECVILHQGLKGKEAYNQTLKLLEDVGIHDVERRYKQYPHEFSGGMPQRIVIAIAIACDPKILICDEPTTALDVTIQAQILQLLKNLQKKYGLTTIYITHDLGVVAKVADRIAVMYAGDIIELGKTEEIFFNGKHPYTWALISSLPQLGAKGKELYSIKGTPPNLFKEIKGDAFAPRNPFALNIDFEERPPFFQVSDTHYAKTWLLHPNAPKVNPPAVLQEFFNEGRKYAHE